jgi:hypothetical protein
MCIYKYIYTYVYSQKPSELTDSSILSIAMIVRTVLTAAATLNIPYKQVCIYDTYTYIYTYTYTHYVWISISSYMHIYNYVIMYMYVNTYINRYIYTWARTVLTDEATLVVQYKQVPIFYYPPNRNLYPLL